MLLLNPNTGEVYFATGDTSGGGGSVAYRAGIVSIPDGASVVHVVFSSSWGSDDYIPGFSFMNTVDGVPIMLQGVVTQVTDTGFDVTLNAPVDSGNYKMSYTAWGGQ